MSLQATIAVYKRSVRCEIETYHFPSDVIEKAKNTPHSSIYVHLTIKNMFCF